MATRSERRHFALPYPVILEALANTLPEHGFRLNHVDREHGKVVVDRGWSMVSMGERVTAHVGADDAKSTSVVIDSALRFLGFGKTAHTRNIAQVWAALDSYLSYYYGTTVGQAQP